MLKKWTWLVIGIAAELILLIFVFRTGMMVGTRRAEFNMHWGENYGRFFGEPRRGFFPEFMGGGMMNAFGNSGTVLKLQDNVIVMKGSDGNERTVSVSSSTDMRKGRQDIKISDIKIGEPIVVIGEPGENGQIEARFLRVFSLPSFQNK
jgi:hypothetical protein